MLGLLLPLRGRFLNERVISHCRLNSAGVDAEEPLLTQFILALLNGHAAWVVMASMGLARQESLIATFRVLRFV